MALSLMAYAHEGARAVLGDRRAKTLVLLGLAEALCAGGVLGWGMALAFVAGLAAVIYGVLALRWIGAKPQGDDLLRQAASGPGRAIRSRWEARYPGLAKFGGAGFVLIGLALGWAVAWGCALGVALAGLLVWMGAEVPALARHRAAEAARLGVGPAFAVVLRGGAALGGLALGLGLLGLAGYYSLLLAADAQEVLRPLVGVAFGVSLVALAARLEAWAGDGAAVALDLFETYIATLVATMLLGGLLAVEAGRVYPLVLAGVGLAAALAAVALARLDKGRKMVETLYQTTLLAVGLALAVDYPATLAAFAGGGAEVSAHGVFFAAVLGGALALLLAVLAEYHADNGRGPVRRIVEADAIGPAARIGAGFAVVLRSTTGPVLAICACLWGAHQAAGLYGIAVAATALVSLAGVFVVLEAYGSGLDGLAARAGLPKTARDATATLDAVGAAARPVVRAYSVGAAGLAALALFFAYARRPGGAVALDLGDYRVVIGLFVGGLLPYLFGGLLMEAAGRTGRNIQEALVPAALPLAVPVLVGVALGKAALGGLMVGVIVTGLFLAVAVLIGGAAWESAKRYLGNSARAKSGLAPGTDPVDAEGFYKAVVGPALPPLMKLVNLVALLVVSWL